MIRLKTSILEQLKCSLKILFVNKNIKVAESP